MYGRLWGSASPSGLTAHVGVDPVDLGLEGLVRRPAVELLLAVEQGIGAPHALTTRLGAPVVEVPKAPVPQKPAGFEVPEEALRAVFKDEA